MAKGKPKKSKGDDEGMPMGKGKGKKGGKRGLSATHTRRGVMC